MKEILTKLGFGDNISIVNLLAKLKTEKFAWIVIRPFQEYYTSDLYFKWNDDV